MPILKQLFNRVFKFLKVNQDFLLITVISLIKVVFFNYEIGLQYGTNKIIISSTAVLLVLSCGFILLPFLARTILLVIFDISLSVLLLADTLFFRFNHAVISIPVLFEVSEVKGISSSVFALLSRSDGLFFADLLLLIPYVIYLYKRKVCHSSNWLRRFSQFIVIMLLCSLTLNLTTNKAVANFNATQYIGKTLDQSVLNNLGVVNYHLFEMYTYFKKSDNKEIMLEAAPKLRTWLEDHRQQSTDLQGAAKNKNLIIVQLEALQNFLIGRSINGQEITPNLNKLKQSSIYFDNYFTQVGQGNTSDAEFMTLNSLYPAPSGSNYVLNSDNIYESLPWLLKSAGYQGSYAFHAFKPDFWNREAMYRAEGFDEFYNSTNFFSNDEILGMGLADGAMYRQVVGKLKELQEPYFSFIISLSGHYPYTMPSDKQTLNIPENQYSQIFVDYLQAQHYADQALGEFIAELKNQGILDTSILVLYGDHYGTGWTNQDIESFLGIDEPDTNYFWKQLNQVPLFIRLPQGQNAGIRHNTGGQMDLFPTLLNLLGLNRQDAVYFGQDLINTSKTLSTFRVWMPDGSFATDDVLYIASWDGIFENGTAYDRKTGEKIGLQGLEEYYDKAKQELHASDLILQTDGLSQLIPIEH